MSSPQSTPEQLLLHFDHRIADGREDYLVTPSNQTAVAMVDRWPDWPDQVIALSGPAGCGKTHLSHVWGEKAKAVSIEAKDLGDADIGELLHRPAIVVENMHQLSTSGEAALFHLINGMREQSAYLLLTGIGLPGYWPAQLPDLSSRIKALHFVEIAPPDDGLLGAVLIKLFDDRQLKVSLDVISYLTPRIERSTDAARTVVAAIDEAAMVQKRRITLPFVRETLAALDGHDQSS